ncbi:Hypothetical predicted protein [Olea europaea subsp. europaea]|uniref:Nascent polypeptide-associated complex subunit alpha-like UBA domain-containing protein n=1 Tax=Olea europaea subsp. europaea TaxID=158383 RepID=A0A8S0UHX1_OLEEU|nr:Hypothetical predicted protein [Olea europaea subsp. europaea]
MEDSNDLQQQSKALDKLTDRVEDRQLYSTRVQEINFMIYFSMYGCYLAMASIAAPKEADIQPARVRVVIIILFLVKELAAVKINAANVDVIANELELDKKVAERTLCENKADAVAAIRSLLY